MKPVIVFPRGYPKHVWRSREQLCDRNYVSRTVPMMKPLAIAPEIRARYGTDFLEETQPVPDRHRGPP